MSQVTISIVISMHRIERYQAQWGRREDVIGVVDPGEDTILTSVTCLKPKIHHLLCLWYRGTVWDCVGGVVAALGGGVGVVEGCGIGPWWSGRGKVRPFEPEKGHVYPERPPWR